MTLFEKKEEIEKEISEKKNKLSQLEESLRRENELMTVTK